MAVLHASITAKANASRPSSVQASFGFNFGALAARPAEQASLPPQLSSRRTPARNTPRGAHGSAQQHRRASVQRSGASKRKSTPSDTTTTPRLGKRKRGSPNAEPGADNGDDDELSLDREELVRSIEKSRRVVGTVSPTREEVDSNVPDELSILEEAAVFGRSTRMKRSPIQALEQKQATPARAPQGTPIADRIGGMSVTSRQSTARRSQATDPGPVTPSLLPNRRPRLPASRFGPDFDTAAPAPAPAEESEDELSPQANGATPRVVGRDVQPTTPEDAQMNVVDELSPQTNGATPRRVGMKSQSTTQEDPGMNVVDGPSPQANGATPRAVSSEPPPRRATTHNEETEMDIDELSSPMQPTTVQNTPAATAIVVEQVIGDKEPEEQASATRPAKRGRLRRVVEDDEDKVTAAAPAKPVQRGRSQKEVPQASEPQASPAARKPKTAKNLVVEQEREEVDELSPDRTKTLQQPAKSAKRKEDVVEISSAPEDSDEYEESEHGPEEAEPTPRPVMKRHSPKQKQTHRVKPSAEKPRRKREKFLGPKYAISVMRIKGSAVRGITVADTTRTILEETIDHRLNRMAEELQISQDSDRRKELRSEINLSISFKESLNEKLLDLQDANDVLSTNFKKTKLFRRDNADLRKEILGLQNSRQEIAVEQDDVQAEYDAEKAKVEARNTLSDNMFEIEAAIQSGRDKARKEGRENEGPEIPLRMLLETVGKDVGSRGGGLLANVKGFNGLLERAAGWLEGRV
jgi:hypothetical protein